MIQDKTTPTVSYFKFRNIQTKNSNFEAEREGIPSHTQKGKNFVNKQPTPDEEMSKNSSTKENFFTCFNDLIFERCPVYSRQLHEHVLGSLSRTTPCWWCSMLNPQGIPPGSWLDDGSPSSPGLPHFSPRWGKVYSILHASWLHNRTSLAPSDCRM